MANLQINTPKGQETLIQEDFVIKEIEKFFNVKIIETEKKREGKCDCIMFKEVFDDIKKRTINKLFGITENKCRNYSLSQMRKHGNTWLVTYQKILDCQALSRELVTPFFGFCYLMDDDVILYWKITDDNGEFLFPFEIKESETQYCVNPELGTTIRLNAYLPRKYAKVLYDGNNIVDEFLKNEKRISDNVLQLKKNLGLK